MSEIVAGESAFYDTIEVADDGDPRAAATTAAAIQAVLNNTGYLLLLAQTIGASYEQRTARPALDLSDADHTVNISSANVFVLADNPTAIRTITINWTGIADESWMRFVLKRGTSPNYYRLKQAGSADHICDVAAYHTPTGGLSTGPCSVELQFRSGLWRVTGACPGIILGADA